MAGNDEGAVERHRPPCPQAISTRTVHVAPTGRSRVSSSVAHHDGTYRARRLGLRALDACVREAARSHRGARDTRLVANILIGARAIASPPEPGHPVSIAPDYRVAPWFSTKEAGVAERTPFRKSLGTGDFR